MIFAHALPQQLVASLFWNGQPGVQIFFVVSGFLITSTSLLRWGLLSGVSARDFYLLRFARIVPLFLALLAVLSVLDLMHARHFIISSETGGLGRALFAALTLHVNVLEAHRGYLPANWDILWSLSVEEMFYLFFPPLCILLGRRRLLISLLAIFVLLGPVGRTVLAHNNEIWREYSYLGGMDAIALGCLTALLVSRVRFSRGALWFLACAGAAVLFFSLGLSITADAWGLQRAGIDMTILALGTCMVIIFAAQSNWRSPRLLRPITGLGQRSYEVYLTHMFVVFALFDFFLSSAKASRAIPPLFVVIILASGLFGDLIARIYSEPMNRLLRNYWGDGRSRLGAAIPAPQS